MLDCARTVDPVCLHALGHCRLHDFPLLRPQLESRLPPRARAREKLLNSLLLLRSFQCPCSFPCVSLPCCPVALYQPTRLLSVEKRISRHTPGLSTHPLPTVGVQVHPCSETISGALAALGCVRVCSRRPSSEAYRVRTCADPSLLERVFRVGLHHLGNQSAIRRGKGKAGRVYTIALLSHKVGKKGVA